MSEKNEPVKFEMKGAKEFAEMLSKLPAEMEEKILYNINREAANMVKKEMLANAPSGGEVSEDIKKSIQVRKDKENATGVTVGIVNKKDSKGFIQRFLEYGTAKRATKKGADRGAITQPEPFVKKSIDGKIQDVIKAVTESYGDLIEKYLKREVKKVNKKAGK